MPKIFKALATIMAWVLWLAAIVMGFSTFIMGLVNGDLFGSEPVPLAYPVSFAVAAFYGVAAIVVMRLRQGMK